MFLCCAFGTSQTRMPLNSAASGHFVIFFENRVKLHSIKAGISIIPRLFGQLAQSLSQYYRANSFTGFQEICTDF